MQSEHDEQLRVAVRGTSLPQSQRAVQPPAAGQSELDRLRDESPIVMQKVREM